MHFESDGFGLWERSRVGPTPDAQGPKILTFYVVARDDRSTRAFEMIVLGYDPYMSAEHAEGMGVELVADLDQLLGRCDFLTLHLPATGDTLGMLNAERLALTKPGVRIRPGWRRATA